MSKLLAIGKGVGTVVGVISTDKDGNPLKMNNGGTYRKLKISVIDRRGEGGYVYDPIFGGDKDKIADIVDAIGDKHLKEKFKNGTLQDKELFGFEMICQVGVREPKPGSGHDPQNTIDCYIPKRVPTATEILLNGATPEYVPQQRPVGGMSDAELSDDVPF